MEDGKPKVWTVATVEVLSTCDACGETEMIDMQIGLTKKEGLKEARILGWRMARGRWVCPECEDAT